MLRALKQLAAFLHRWTIGWFTRVKPLKKPNSRQQRLHIESLEDRRVFAAGFAEFLDPHPAPDNGFGASVVPLSTGNVVVTSPGDDAGGTDAGAVYLFSGRTGALISAVRGSHPSDFIGSEVKELANGNFVIVSPSWSNGALQNVGAITWGSGTVGIDGVVSPENSLVGTVADDQIGFVKPLTNGNYVASNYLWDNGETANVGAVCWGSGNGGLIGQIDVNRCLIGGRADDQIGIDIQPLTNGNFVVRSPYWNNGAGAATFGDGTKAIVGTVGAANSLIGTSDVDEVSGGEVTPLSNGNYVVVSRSHGGAATWGDGTKGVVGELSADNSLIGTKFNGSPNRVFPLANGNYVVVNSDWDNGDVPQVGAVTFVNGDRGLVGPITAANSLIGAFAADRIGSGGVYGLKNGNYLVKSPYWHTDRLKSRGAWTLGNGTTGSVGSVTSDNSLVGPYDDYYLGDAIELANGNFVVESGSFNAFSGVETSAATWGDGLKGVTGTISASNSLISPINHRGSRFSVTALTNGNYVVASPGWGFAEWAQQGAVTWGDGHGGTTGEVSEENSLVGARGDQVGSGGVTALTNGNYVVVSSAWEHHEDGNKGAVTFATGNLPLVGFVSETNSLIGPTPGDSIGSWGVTALPNGNYVVRSPTFTNKSQSYAGAATFGSGVAGVQGPVTTLNSLVGEQPGAQVSSREVISFSNGNYLVVSPVWDDTPSLPDVGAITFGSGTRGISGPIYIDSSLTGDAAGSGNHLAAFDAVFIDDVNQTFYARFLGDGRVCAGSQIDGIAHRWHLAVQPQDVNNDGTIAPNDVLTIINYINAGKNTVVSSIAAVGKPYGFLDVTGDDNVIAEDVIAVINYINAGHPTEGEAPNNPTIAPTTPTAPAASLPPNPPNLTDSLLLLLASDNSSAKKRR